MATIDKVCKEEANSYVLFDPQVIRGLYRRGLMYFDVPVYQDDRFKGSIFFIVTFFYIKCCFLDINLLFGSSLLLLLFYETLLFRY